MLNKQEAVQMARENILPFWHNMADREHGGFFGEADFYGKINKTTDKGCILNSRILWTFSAAYRLFNDEIYKDCAMHAREFLKSAFYDKEYGGLYWLTDNSGKPLQTRKQFYNIAFGIYALSEHYLACGDNSSLELAMDLFGTTEKYGYDKEAGGYIEACARDWEEISDFRLSGKDLNSPKSMNTNLHVLEAYTTLLTASKDARVKKALEGLLRITFDKIVGGSRHFELFFDMNWKPLSREVSWGHDIEGSWLMYEAALALGDEKITGEAKDTAVAIADVIHSAAIDSGKGGLLSGLDEKGKLLAKKEWWPQAEAVVGFYNAYQLSGEQKFFDAACGIWEYIKNYFTDRENGEWFNELSPDNIPDVKMPKAGFWKCPYHNARTCFEIIKRMK
ncbi:MAG: AGE family epimerase/isomerase [Treponema sp.]|nr:AGE family epimerase/isomerase [Treponema sp.]MCL2272598.1 AGE family epimerase/isomerase [Treponema sp.]